MTNKAKALYMRVRESEDVHNDPPLATGRKLCFAVGGVPYQMTTTVIGFFLNIFLLEVAELKPSYVAVVLFTGKAWDAITDPTCGFLVQRTRSRWGRFRPWILFSTPLACLSYFLLFYVPGGYRESVGDSKPSTHFSMEAKLAYYLAAFCLFEGFLSGLHVPYTSLTMYVTHKQKERDSITAYRMVLEAVGVLAAVLTQGQLVQDTRCKGDEDVEKKTQTVQDMLDQGWSYRIGSFIVVGLYLCCSLTVFFGVKEKGVDYDDQKDAIGFWAGLKLVFSYGPYVKAALTFLFLSIAIGIVQGNVALYTTHTLKMANMFSIFILVLLVVSIVSMPVWHYIAVRFGKKTAYAGGLLILLPTFFCQMFIPEKSEALYFVVMVLAGFGISVALLLPWLLLPDVLDLFMLEKRRRQDALFYAFYVFFGKLAIGLGLGISQVALQFGGYSTDSCSQPDSVGYTLRLLVTPAPVVCILLALLFLWGYPIDEDKRHQIKQDLLAYHEKMKAELTASTMSYESISVPATQTVNTPHEPQHRIPQTSTSTHF